MGNAHDELIGKAYPVCLLSQILDHMLGSGQRRFEMYYPRRMIGQLKRLVK